MTVQDKLFGNKFRKLLAKDSKDNRELSELVPTRKRFKSDKYASDKKDVFRTGDRSLQFFRTGPSNNRFQCWGHNYRGQFNQIRRGYRGTSRTAITITRKTENQ